MVRFYQNIRESVTCKKHGKYVTAFLMLIWGHILLSHVCFNWQDKERRMMCPKDASQEKAGSQGGCYFVPIKEAVRILW